MPYTTWQNGDNTAASEQATATAGMLTSAELTAGDERRYYYDRSAGVLGSLISSYLMPRLL